MTMTTVEGAILAVQDVVSAVTGIRMAPDVAPEQIPAGGVFGLAYPATGTFEVITADPTWEGRHTLHLMLATTRTHMRTDWARIIPLGDTVAAALLAANTMSGQIVQLDELRYTFGDLEWGGQQMFGWLFEIDVRVSDALS